MDICLTSSEDLIVDSTWDDRIFAGNYSIYIKQPSKYHHFWGTTINHHFVFLFGNIFHEVDESYFSTLYVLFSQGKYSEIMDLDGEFISGCIDEKNGDVIVISEKEGVIPVYYKKENDNLTITTDEMLLFKEFSLADLNYHAVNDYLRFGCLVGSETMSKSVYKIMGGSVFRADAQRITIDRIYRFFYSETSNNIECLMDEVSFAYRNAILKRVKGKEKDTCIFLSGGIDSRFLLAEMNNALTTRVGTYSFGQASSEEVNIARECAEVESNPFTWIKVSPADFVNNSEEYESIVCGADLFPQSYIINAVKKINENHFITGYILDACLGGTFLTEETIDYKGKLSEYVSTHLKQLKMNVFTKQELIEMCLNEEVAKTFEYDDKGLVEEARYYDSIPVKDCVQAFAIDNRAKNLVLLREIVPAKYKDCSYVSCDKEFMEAISHIGAELRLNHKFYHNLFLREAHEYSKIVYNNTQLPVLTPVDRWKDGSKQESKRETIYEEIIKQYNIAHEDKIYYPHYYSDFNGYSRYDSDWIDLFKKYLFSSDTIITKILFKEEELSRLFNQHLNDKLNRRKELVQLTSLEIFLRNTIVNGNRGLGNEK